MKTPCFKKTQVHKFTFKSKRMSQIMFGKKPQNKQTIPKISEQHNCRDQDLCSKLLTTMDPLCGLMEASILTQWE